LPRERLFSYFDRLKDQGIVWISGPAGSGKTTLVTNYVDARIKEKGSSLLLTHLDG